MGSDAFVRCNTHNKTMNITETPLFVDTGENAPREGVQWVVRDVITAVVYDPSTDKVIGLRWQNAPFWETLITGGIEENQSPEDAARAEILQETGYANLELVSELPPYDSKFYHHAKEVNRYGHFRCFLFRLKDDERQEVSEKELKVHVPVWLTREELETFRLAEGHRYTLDNAYAML
jgi:8-oxo-dGTP pyrophosphatase MutT (NUDIX family)